MKRTTHARHVAVGNVEETPETVDKGRVWGKAYRDRERIERELAGVSADTYDCEPCGITLQIFSKGITATIRDHEATKRHCRLTS
jgi:hypothetical protein